MRELSYQEIEVINGGMPPPISNPQPDPKALFFGGGFVGCGGYPIYTYFSGSVGSSGSSTYSYYS